MKGISGTMLGLAFVLYSLFSLVSVNRTWDSRSAPLGGPRYEGFRARPADRHAVVAGRRGLFIRTFRGTHPWPPDRLSGRGP